MKSLDSLISRREAYRIALAGAGAVLIGESNWEVLWAQGRAPQIFVSCRVSELRGETISCISDDARFIQMKITDKTDIWMGIDGITPSALKVGQHLYVVGQVDSNGTLFAANVHVNILNVYGRIVAVRGSEFDLVPYQPEALNLKLRCVVNATVHTQCMNTNCTTLGVQRLLYAQVVGMQNSDGAIAVTKLWVYPGRPADKK